MRIAETSPARLVLTDRPWFVIGAVWLVAMSPLLAALTGHGVEGPWHRALILAIGLGLVAAAWWYVTPVTVIFDRRAGTVTRQVHRITGTSARTVALGEVNRVRQVSTRSESGARMRRLVLETGVGEIPLQTMFGASNHDSLKTAIDDWLTRPGAPV